MWIVQFCCTIFIPKAAKHLPLLSGITETVSQIVKNQHQGMSKIQNLALEIFDFGKPSQIQFWINASSRDGVISTIPCSPQLQTPFPPQIFLESILLVSQDLKDILHISVAKQMLEFQTQTEQPFYKFNGLISEQICCQV